MKRINGFIIVTAIAMIAVSCMPNKKEKTAEDECEGCPEPISIEVPAELNGNKEVVAFIGDGEKMYNKWAKRAYLLAKEMEKYETTDPEELSFSESMAAAKIGMKMLSYMSEFMGESLTMDQRRQDIEDSMSEEEKAAFNKVINQFEEGAKEITASFEEMGMDVPQSNEDVLELLEEESQE